MNTKMMALAGLALLSLIATAPLSAASADLAGPTKLESNLDRAIQLPGWPCWLYVAVRDHTVTVTVDNWSVSARTPGVTVCVN